MKTSTVGLGFVAMLLQASSVNAKLYRKNLLTFEVGDAKIEGNKIVYSDPDCEPELECLMTKTCNTAGTTPTLSKDKTHFACCKEGQSLLGSPETAFDCCAADHDLAGSADVGYHCCPTGFSYDGNVCKQVCQNGRVLVDGQCVCPEGTVDAGDGTCKTNTPKPKPQTECTSGLESGKFILFTYHFPPLPFGPPETPDEGPTIKYLHLLTTSQGKCYTFAHEDGRRLGIWTGGVYYVNEESINQRDGRFKLCLDEECTKGRTVNPNDKVHIKDILGDVRSGANRGKWLNNAKNGGHIAQTANFADAGLFTLSKWPCGKYCLGGFDGGVGPACPANTPALTFYPQDPQMCMVFELTEVPCDIKAEENNCIWAGGDQCCNKVDCSAKHG